MKAAVITGVTGQDGSYLAELLLEKNYSVFGIARRTSTQTTERISGILDNANFHLREADMGDANSIRSVFEEASAYDRVEVYNLAAQSHVHTSFRQPEYTADVDAIGPLRILEAIRSLRIENKTRVYRRLRQNSTERYKKPRRRRRRRSILEARMELQSCMRFGS